MKPKSNESSKWSRNIAIDHFGNQFLFKWQQQNNANKINSQSKSVKIRKLCQYRTMNCLHKFSITKKLFISSTQNNHLSFHTYYRLKGGDKRKGIFKSTKHKIQNRLLSSLTSWLCRFQFGIQNFSQNSYLNSWRILTRKTR